MSDTCGPTSGTPLAQYDLQQQCWKTSEATSLWALTLSSLTLPTWGGLHAGVLYELPTPERPTIERAYSSLPTPRAQARDAIYDGADYRYNLEEALAKLPTPRAQNGEARNQTIYKREGPQNLENALALLPTPLAEMGNLQREDFTPNLRTVIEGNAMLSGSGRLLPTPAVNDMGAGKDPQAWDEWTERMKEAHGNGNGHGKSLEQEALKMLPTPRAQDEYERRNYKTMVRIRDEGGDMTLPTWATVVAPSLGDTTPPPLTAGSTSSGDPHQPQLFADESETA